MPARATDSESHRWAIDGLEDLAARVEEDGRTILTVPRWLLPPDAREGQLLSVTRASSPGSSIITITVDTEATETALKRSADSVAKIASASKRRDRGGDVSL